MKKICLILILGYSALSPAVETNRVVLCEGSVRARSSQGKVFDQGYARMVFQLSDSSTLKNIKIATKFSKIKPQNLEAFQSLAAKRAIASGKFKADFFNVGNNGACQMGLGYQGDIARSAKPVSSWGLFMMGCGNYGVVGNLKCQMR